MVAWRTLSHRIRAVCCVEVSQVMLAVAPMGTQVSSALPASETNAIRSASPFTLEVLQYSFSKKSHFSIVIYSFQNWYQVFSPFFVVDTLDTLMTTSAFHARLHLWCRNASVLHRRFFFFLSWIWSWWERHCVHLWALCITHEFKTTLIQSTNDSDATVDNLKVT